jgi:hypothetical protein
MHKLTNISVQQFYYSTIDQLIERCSQQEKCALIIDNNQFDDLVNKGMNIIGDSVNQIIIISGNMNTSLPQLIGKDVLLMAADNFEQAARFAIYGEALSTNVICCVNQDENAVNAILGGIVV